MYLFILFKQGNSLSINTVFFWEALYTKNDYKYMNHVINSPLMYPLDPNMQAIWYSETCI